MSYSNDDIESLVHDFLRNSLGVDAPTTFSVSSPNHTNMHRVFPRTTNESPIENLISEITNRIHEIRSENATHAPAPTNRRRYQTHGVPNFSGNRVTPEVWQPTDHRRRPEHPEFAKMLHAYHYNMLEYNYTIQQIIQSITSLRNRTRSGSVHEIYETGLQYNRNIQDYNKIMETSLDLYSDLYFSYNSNDRNNYSTPANVNTVPASANTRATNPPSGTNTTNNLPVISRPQAIVSYTVFPYIPSVSTDVEEVLLTENQIQEFTEQYIFSRESTDISNASPSCPISLDLFQEGDSILKIRHCGHEFKSAPLRRWFQRSSHCPLCRCNLLSPVTNINRTSRSSSLLDDPTTDRRSIEIRRDALEAAELNDPLAVQLHGNTVQISDVSLNTTSGSSYSTLPQVVYPDNEPSSSTGLTDLMQENENSDEQRSGEFTRNEVIASLRHLLESTDHTTNNTVQSIFNDVFQNMLMNSTDAPPNISNIPSWMPIESIDITYTIDYDVSGN